MFYSANAHGVTWSNQQLAFFEEEIALQEEANELNPRSPWMFSRYQHLGLPR